MNDWLLGILMTVMVHAAGPQPVFQKGMSYTPWSKDALSTENSDRSIANMKEIGVDWVALTVFWFQDDRTSTVIEEDFDRYSASRESVERAIREIHMNGMKVMLKPHVDARSGDWRGTIVPSEGWFESYEEYIVEWGKFAETNRAELFCVGCEYVETARTSTWEPHWRRIIASVRDVYSGPLTYASNHGNEQSVRWWDALDYIGIDAYYALTNENDPTQEELIAAWRSRADKIEAWRNRRWPDKPILFTEIGYRSYDGANRQPWDYNQTDAQNVDVREQMDCYTAALQVLTERDWFYGFYWWNWETNPSAGGDNHVGYTVQNKATQDLLEDWYENGLTGGRYGTAGLREHELYK